METIFFAIIVFCLAVAALSIGVLFGRAPIKGSCGGLNCIEGADCAACDHKARSGA